MRAEEDYRAYVVEHGRALEELTRQFADAMQAGDDVTARALYLDARSEWHRIRAVATTVSELVVAVDAQRAELGAQEEWTGWHRLEADLWPSSGEAPLSQAERQRLTDLLVSDTETLVAELADPNTGFPPEVIASVASMLVESTIQSSLAGTAEPYSGANLLAARAQVDGARAAIEAVELIATERDLAAVQSVDTRLHVLEALLASHPGELDALTAQEVIALARAAEALAEPLSRLASIVVDP
jgi:iron uptake system component EfeO